MSDAYDTVELRPSWLGCSLLCFGGLVVFAVALPLLIYRVGVDLHGLRVAVLAVIPVASLVGTVAGLVALRRGAARTLAGLAFVLNFAVFASCVAAVVITVLR